jgi:outer membrane protein assembly factor BamB
MGRRTLMLMCVIAAAAAALLAILGPSDERWARAPDNERVAPPLAQPRRVSSDPLDGAPREVTAAAREWPLAHHDYANTRATTDARITSANIGRLRPAWDMQLSAHSHWGAAASAPLIADGIVYFQDLQSDVSALDLRSGRLHWKYRVKQEAFGPNGPAIGYGKVFLQDGVNGLRAVDLRSGRPLWSTPLAGPTGAQQPVAFGGYVYTGLASGRIRRVSRGNSRMALIGGGSSGFAYGLREDTGGMAWQFRTVQRGFWGNASVNSGGGIWFPPAIDTATRRTFWSTGNPGPGPGTVDFPNASSRPGPNLYTNSVLALDGRDGRKAWHYQVKPHDLFHHDLQNPPILASAGGHDLVIASGKGGYVFAIDRESGELVWKTPVGIHRNDLLRTLPEDDREVRVYPGFWGGVETPGAYADGTLYYLTENLATPYTATAFRSRDGAENVQNMEGRTPLDEGTSELVAIDAATGRIRWTHKFGMVGFGGATVVNDLVFTATYDGTVYALARGSGRVLWSHRLPAGVIAWPAVAGDTIVWPAGLGRRPALVALRLDGADAPEPPPETRVTGTTP